MSFYMFLFMIVVPIETRKQHMLLSAKASLQPLLDLLFVIYFYFMYMSAFPASMYKSISEDIRQHQVILELVFQVTVNYHVGTGNQP